MRRYLLLIAAVFVMFDASAQNVAIGKYTTREDLSKAFLANIRAIPNTKFTLRSSDKSGGTIQAVRLIRNQELGSLFILVTQDEGNSVLIEATFTRNGGFFGGGDPEDWAKEFAEQLKTLLPDLTEVDDRPAGDGGPLERVVALQYREPIPLGIIASRTTIDSVEVSGRPKEEAIQKAESQPDATTKLVVELTYSNRGKKDLQGEYVLTILDDADKELGSGRRTVSLDEGEIGDSHRVGVTLRTIDVPKATKLRVQLIPGS